MPMLSVRNLSKSFPGADGVVQALADVSLEVGEGELVAVRGPSGSGKTTLLLAAGGLLAPDSGTVELDGRQPYMLDPDARAALRAAAVGFVFQQFHLVPYLSVLDNVLAPTLAGDVPDAEGNGLVVLTDAIASITTTSLTHNNNTEASLSTVRMFGPTIRGSQLTLSDVDADLSSVLLDGSSNVVNYNRRFVRTEDAGNHLDHLMKRYWRMMLILWRLMLKFLFVCQMETWRKRQLDAFGLMKFCRTVWVSLMTCSIKKD